LTRASTLSARDTLASALLKYLKPIILTFLPP
jgi:hypothetical protein